MKILITGGCGFIGTHTAEYFHKKGYEVVILDSFSREGSEENEKYLESLGINDIYFGYIDRADGKGVDKAVLFRNCDAVIHLAAQVAVTKSILNSYDDFFVNALGTLNVLRAVQIHCPDAIFINASTNKVYGDLSQYKVDEHKSRYALKGKPYGIDEKEQLSFHSPYGCSKGAADQYTLDYHRTYGLKTVSIRQSCIYGERQYGIEDQGWLAHFAISAIKGEPVTIYGSGKQVRDALYVGDLVKLYEKCIENIDIVKGHAINAGGGTSNTISIIELINFLSKYYDFEYSFGEERKGDQKVFVSDNSKAFQMLGWKPETPTVKGLEKMVKWIKGNI